MGNSKGKTNLKLGLVFSLSLLASCMPETHMKKNGSTVSDVTILNVSKYNGRVFLDNPAILSGNLNLKETVTLDSLAKEQYITQKQLLQSEIGCLNNKDSLTTFNCFDVKDNINSTTPLVSPTNKWGFRAKTTEFLQTNSYFHLNKAFSFLFDSLATTRENTLGKTTSIPTSIITNNYYNFFSKTLTTYANCDELNNAYFNPSTMTLCFGYSGQNKNVLWAHDSTVIYHEIGHFQQYTMLNVRNNNQIVQAQLGNFLYTEAGALGEGLADYYSYYLTGRSHWGEWAPGKLNASRPLSESDNLHIAGLAEDNNSRLRYPDFLTYDPNNPTAKLEDIHYAGQIVSHYLVALTKDLVAKCGLSNLNARKNVMSLVSETFAELGDLTTTGTHKYTCISANNCSDVMGPAGKVNLNPTYANEWLQKNNPINYRSFMQTFAKNLLTKTQDGSICPVNSYPKDTIETLIDSYGLLNFTNYNQYRNFSSLSNVNTQVSPSNRQKTTLINKSNLILDPAEGAVSAYVIDTQADVNAAILTLQASGIIKDLSTQTEVGLAYNNGNGQINLGEVVGISLNLYNASNATMGGVQILANDWHHAKIDSTDNKLKPCSIKSTYTSNAWPTVEEGALNDDCTTMNATPVEDDFAPVCLVQQISGNSTKWISQKQLLEDQNGTETPEKICLDSSRPKECYIRAIKGADSAYLGKIDPKKTWLNTMYNEASGKAYSPNIGNLIFFEVSKHIPNGTTFNCRLRVRFTNCKDCYNEDGSASDYKDIDYNGAKPFNIIHLKFTVKE